MKITVRNTDGRLGTGVSAIEYTTQKDGGVSKTVKSAPLPKKGTPSGAAPIRTKAKRDASAMTVSDARGYPSARPSVSTGPSAVSPSSLGRQYQEALGRAITAPASPSRMLYHSPAAQRAPVNESGYSIGQGLADVLKKGANQVAQAGAATLGLAEDVVNAPFELFSGMELGSLRRSGEGIFNPLSEKVRAEGAALAEKSAENVRKGGAVAKALDTYGTGVVAAVPQAVLAMLTGGSSAAAQAAAQTTRGVARTAASQLSPGITRTIRNVVGDLARDPQYWSSFSQVVGSGYQQALEDGASMPKAALYAVGNGLMNAAVEVGGGVETLPGELQNGASGWRALVDSAMDEGKEEVVQGVIERAMQNLTYQKGNPLASVRNPDAVFNPLTAAEEFAGGAVVGGILSGGQIAAQSVINARADRQVRDVLEMMERAAQAGNAARQAETATEARPAASGGTDTSATENAARAPQKSPESIILDAVAEGEEQGKRVVRETFELLQRAAGMETEDAGREAGPKTDSAGPSVLEQEVQRLFGGGKRLSPDAMTAEQRAVVERANEQGTVDMDAENRVYRVNPEEHIDRRDIQSAGDKRVRAFQFDHPQLHPYYAQAARALAAELEHYVPGGETASRVSEDGNAYSYRLRRSATPRIAELIDHYGVNPDQIGNALEAIIQDRGTENYAAAKRLELMLDDMLSNGYQDAFSGEFVQPDQEYTAMKRQIAGAMDVGRESVFMDGDDGLGAADAGFTTQGMEGQERTSRMAQSHPYNQYQEAATAMTREEYDRLFRYQSQTEAKTTHLAEELVYVLQNGKKTFLKDVNEDAYNALTESLREATAWNAEQSEAAKMIELELLGRSNNGEIASEEYADWLKTVREHGTATGQGIQAFAKWSRTDNNRGQATASQAVETIQTSGLSSEQKQRRTKYVLDMTQRINNVEEGNARALQDIILEIAQERGTTTGPMAKHLTGVLRKAMDGLTFQELKQFAFSSTEAVATDAKPLDRGDVIKTIQVLNMLSSFKTPGRNLTGNSAFYALDALSMDGAALLDMALSNATGTRSVAMGGSPINRAMRENALKSAKMSTLEAALDVDMGSGETMYGTGGQRTFRAGAQREGKAGKALNFTERVLSALERNNSFLLTVPDEFFKGMARGNEANLQNLIDQGKIKTENSNYAAEQTDALAKYRTFQDTNAASAISSGIHDLLNLIGTGDSGKKIKGLTVHSAGLGDLVSPFSRVAANLAARGVDYNPVNAVRGVVEMGTVLYDAKHGKTIDPARQAKAVSNTARGLSGTAVIGGFLALLSAGLIRRANDEGDENVAALNRSEGRTGYQFNLSAARRWMDGESQKWRNGDKLLDISSLQPFNELLGVADQIYHDENKTPASLLADDVLGMMYAAADIPVLQTVGDLAKDLTLYKKDPLEALGEAAVNTAVSSVTPNLLRSVAQGLDDRPRSINREDGLGRMAQDELKSRIPGLRQTLPGGVDPTGADKTYPGSRLGNFLNSTVNPLGLNTYEQTEQSQEWQRLREETGRTDFYPSKRIPKKLEGKGLSKELSYEQRQDFQRDRGVWLMLTVSEMMGNRGYQSSDTQRQSDLMADVREFSNAAAKRAVLGPESVDKWVNGALEAQKATGLSPASVIYYKDMLSREKKKDGVSSRDAGQTVRNAIYRDGTLTASQKNALDDMVISDVIVIPQDKNVDYSNEDSFVVSQMSDSAVKHWPLVQKQMPDVTGEQYQTAWKIATTSGTKKDPYTEREKKQDMREELDLSASEVARLWRIIEKAMEK